jgi:hypothetical protein
MQRLFTGLLMALTTVFLAALCQAADPQPAAGQTPATGSSEAWLLVANLPAVYYNVYGEYPSSWAALRSSGLVQVDLLSAKGERIDPDDKELGFLGDIAYIYNGKHETPSIAWLASRDGVRVRRELCASTNSTYLSAMERSSKAVEEYQVKPDWRGQPSLNLLAVAQILSQVARQHWQENGGKAGFASIEEVLRSPESPLTERSVLPGTGMTIGEAISRGQLTAELGHVRDSASGEVGLLRVQARDAQGDVIGGKLRFF